MIDKVVNAGECQVWVTGELRRSRSAKNRRGVGLESKWLVHLLLSGPQLQLSASPAIHQSINSVLPSIHHYAPSDYSPSQKFSDFPLNFTFPWDGDR